MSDVLLTVDGQVRAPRSFTFNELSEFPEETHVRDISRFSPKRKGDGILLSALLQKVEPSLEQFWLTFHATRDDFAASIPSDPKVIETGVIVFSYEGAPLTVEQGGPVRFLIPDPAVCHTAELDECANVKFLDRIEISASRGRDTRPEDEDEHAKLHQDQEN